MSTTSHASAPSSRDRSPGELRSPQLRLLFLGPATIHLQNWLEEFTNAGAAVRLITLHKPQFNRADLVDLSSRLHIPLNLLRRTRAVRKEISRWQPDVVVAYYASSYGTVARLSRFRPYVVVTAGSDINHALGPRRHLFPFVKYALSGAAAVVCWSDTMRTAVEQFSVPRHRIVVQPRGVPLNRFYGRRRTAENDDVPGIVCLRRFSKIFNHRTLIESCRILDRRGERFHLYLCESGPERPEIERLVIDYGLTGRVTFLGKLPPEQVADILRTCQLYVSLAQTDGASASLFEAMAAGAFPIVSNIRRQSGVDRRRHQWVARGADRS